MRKLILLISVCIVILSGCGHKSDSSLVNIEQFKCQASIQTVFQVLGNTELETSSLSGEYYEYDDLNLWGYTGEAVFKVRDDKDTISSFYCNLTLNTNELEDILSDFSNRYGEYEKTDFSNQTAYTWNIDENESAQLGYNSISITDYGDKKIVVHFSDEWSFYKDEAYYEYIKEKEDENETIKSQTYGDDGERINFVLDRDSEENLSLTIGCYIDTEWKAAYAFLTYSSISELEDFEALNPTIILICGDVTLSSVGLSFDTNNTHIVNSEWVADKLASANYSEEELTEFNNRLQDYLFDFLELNK